MWEYDKWVGYLIWVIISKLILIRKKMVWNPILKGKANSWELAIIRMFKDPTTNAATDAGKPSK
jgi:hypothetical protein